MSATITYSTTLATLSCGSCGIPFAIPTSKYDDVYATGKPFYCPNGHCISYSTPENTQLKRRLDAAEAQLTHTRDQLGSERRSKAALKGHLTRARNLVAKGTCPVPDCGQHFGNVAAHMVAKHPGWHLTDPETGRPVDLTEVSS